MNNLQHYTGASCKDCGKIALKENGLHELQKLKLEVITRSWQLSINMSNRALIWEKYRP